MLLYDVAHIADKKPGRLGKVGRRLHRPTTGGLIPRVGESNGRSAWSSMNARAKSRDLSTATASMLSVPRRPMPARLAKPPELAGQPD